VASSHVTVGSGDLFSGAPMFETPGALATSIEELLGRA
jgi:hypothetical protein